MAKVFQRLECEKSEKDEFGFHSTPDLTKPDSYETIRHRSKQLPNGLTGLMKVVAIEQHSEGWFFHKEEIDWNEVLEQLGRLYPENSYVLDHGCILMENGVDVASVDDVFYDETLKTVKLDRPGQASCWNTSVSIGGFSRDSYSIGIGRDCNGNHTGPRFIQHATLSYPFYMFYSLYGKFYRTLDGHIFRFEKKDLSFVIHRNDELVHSFYSPDKTELFEMKYPGPYTEIGFSFAWGVTEKNYSSIFTDDDGNCFVASDGLIYQSFPSQTSVCVQESRYDEAVEKLDTFVSRYKKIYMTEERKKNYLKHGERWSSSLKIKDWEDDMMWRNEFIDGKSCTIKKKCDLL